jgi:hypothetical protein
MGCVVSESVEYGRVGVVISGLVAITYASGYGRVNIVISGSVAIVYAFGYGSI